MEGVTFGGGSDIWWRERHGVGIDQCSAENTIGHR